MFSRIPNVFIILSILIGFAPMQYISAEPTEDLLNAALNGDLKKAEADVNIRKKVLTRLF